MQSSRRFRTAAIAAVALVVPLRAAALSAQVSTEGPVTAVLDPLTSPGPDYYLDFDLVFTQSPNAESLGTGLRDGFTVSLCDVTCDDPLLDAALDVVRVDAVAGIATEPGYGIDVSQLSDDLPPPGGPAGALSAHVRIGFGPDRGLAQMGPGPVRLVIDVFPELDGLGGVGEVRDVRLLQLPEPTVLTLLTTAALLCARRARRPR